MQLLTKIKTFFNSIFNKPISQKTTQKSKYLYIFPDLFLRDESNEKKIDFDFGIEKPNSISDIKALCQYDFTIILSDPGNGKSRLLKEITLKAEENKLSSFFLDLKKVQNQEIADVIKSYLKIYKPIPKNNKEINNTYDYFSTTNFKLNGATNNAIICLDALDEVSRESQYEIIEKIKKFKNIFPKFHIVISCRDYIFKKFDTNFKELNPKIIIVHPFSRNKVFEFLNEYNFTKDEIERTIDHFYRGFQIKIINNPRTLEIFASIKEKEGLTQALKKSKAELLENFIYAELNEEDNKLNKAQKEIVKRVLEILALTMEIYQSNNLSMDELMSFFEDIKSNLANSFLNQIKIEDFYEKTLLFPVEDGRGIQFQNVEFQEYLAAKEISRLGKVDQVFYDLAVEDSLREIYPAWSNTIKYLIELVPLLQNSIVDFISRKDNTIVFNILEHIALSHEHKISLLDEPNRIKYFQSILEIFNEKSIYLSSSFSKILSLYFSDKIELKRQLEEKERESDSLSIGNILLISSDLLENNKLTGIDNWKNKYVFFLQDTKSSKWIKDISIRALSKFKDISLLKDNFDYDAEIENSLKYTFINVCNEIAPNESYTIDLIIKSIVKDDLNTVPRPDFDSITSKEAFTYLLNKFIENTDLFNHYRSYSFEKFKEDRLIENLKNVYDKDIELLINQIITQENIFIRHNSFIVRLIKLMKEQNKEYIFYLTEYFKQNEINNRNWFNYNEIFEMLLTPENVESFINKMKTIPGSENAMINLFLGFKNSNDDDHKKIFEISQKHFGNRYKELEKMFIENNVKWDRSPAIYDKFKSKLKPFSDKEDVFMTDLFYFYRANKEPIEKYVQAEEKQRLKKLVRGVLEYDFKKATLTIISNTNGTISYREPMNLSIFVNAVSLFNEFGITLNEYRKKLLEYFPFFFGSDNCKFIFDLIPNLEDDEIHALNQFYSTERTDDLFRTNIRNLFNISRNYKITKLIPVIKQFVFNDSIDPSYRVEAMEVIQEVEPDFDFYQKVFLTFKDVPLNGHKRIAVKANSVLIQLENKFKESAIDWRMNEILNYPIKYSEDKHDGFMDSHEIEFQTANFNKPITDLSDEKYLNKFFDLLNNSIELLIREKEFKIYVAYIWNTVMVYFENLKKYQTMNYVILLEEFIMKGKDFEEKRLLLSYLNRVKNNYVTALGKPSSYQECIKKYNEVKEKKYLHIVSPLDLFNMLQEIINSELKKWITQEGAGNLFSKYEFVSKKNISSINTKSQKEIFIQKTIKTQFENFLLRRGLRNNEVNIRREEQLLSDERTDFVISYGFIGQILLEVKLANNSQANNLTDATNYKKKVIKYIDGTRSDYGILLIFQTDESTQWTDIQPMLLDIYKNESRIKVLGLNCVN